MNSGHSTVQGSCKNCTLLRNIRVTKVPFWFLDKVKNEIQNTVLTFVFNTNNENENENKNNFILKLKSIVPFDSRIITDLSKA